MPITVEPVVVRSEEHAALRVGRVTGSVISVIMRGTIRGKNSLLKKMDTPTTFYTLEDSPNMPAPLRWGHINEPWIRGQFWHRHPEYEVDRPAFIRPGDGGYGTSEQLPWPVAEHCGISPDAVLLDDSLQMVAGLECKCPYDEAEIYDCIRQGKWERRFRDQCVLSMLVTGAPAWWLVIGDPREPHTSEFRYWERCIERDEDEIDTMKEKICEFIELWKGGQEYIPPSMAERLSQLDGLL